MAQASDCACDKSPLSSTPAGDSGEQPVTGVNGGNRSQVRELRVYVTLSMQGNPVGVPGQCRCPASANPMRVASQGLLPESTVRTESDTIKSEPEGTGSTGRH